MRIAIFGATGKTGVPLVRQALTAGHEVIALARTPSKLTIASERLTVMQGDIANPAQVAQSLQGADAVISVLGPASNAPDFQVSRGMANILAGMQAHSVRRLIVSTGAGVRDPNDTPKLFDKAIAALLQVVSKNVYADMQRVVAIVRASDRDWTIVRVPMLTDGPKKGTVRVGYVGKGVGARLTRADLADFMLEQIQNQTYLHQTPAISN
jgi:putative NADH-flavin reductase